MRVLVAVLVLAVIAFAYASADDKSTIQSCPDPNQIYVTNTVITPCQHDLCVTFVSCNGTRCPDRRLTRPAPGNGCICKDGYALTSPNTCGRIGSCDCPAIADPRDPRFFDNYECPDL